MHTPQALPPAALRVLAVTAEAWGLCMRAPVPAIRPRRIDVARTPAVHSTPSDLRHWPYWPDYPGAAIGWR